MEDFAIAGHLQEDVAAFHAGKARLDGFTIAAGPSLCCGGSRRYCGCGGRGGTAGSEGGAFFDPGFQGGEFGGGEAVFAFGWHRVIIVVGELAGDEQGTLLGFARNDLSAWFNDFGQFLGGIESEVTLDLALADRMAGVALLGEDGFDVLREVHGGGGHDAGENEGGGEGAFHEKCGFYQRGG